MGRARVLAARGGGRSDAAALVPGTRASSPRREAARSPGRLPAIEIAIKKKQKDKRLVRVFRGPTPPMKLKTGFEAHGAL